MCLEKRYVSSSFLSVSRVAVLLTLGYIAFDMQEAAELRASSLSRRRVRSISRSEFVAKRRLVWRWSVETCCSMLKMYAGALLCVVCGLQVLGIHGLQTTYIRQKPSWCLTWLLLTQCVESMRKLCSILGRYCFVFNYVDWCFPAYCLSWVINSERYWWEKLTLLSVWTLTTVEKSYSTMEVENDASARPQNLTSASCELDLWPPDPQSWSLQAVVLWTNYASLHQNQFMFFQNYFVHMFGRRRTNERISGLEENIMPSVSLAWSRLKKLQLTKLAVIAEVQPTLMSLLQLLWLLNEYY